MNLLRPIVRARTTISYFRMRIAAPVLFMGCPMITAAPAPRITLIRALMRAARRAMIRPVVMAIIEFGTGFGAISFFRRIGPPASKGPGTGLGNGFCRATRFAGSARPLCAARRVRVHRVRAAAPLAMAFFRPAFCGLPMGFARMRRPRLTGRAIIAENRRRIRIEARVERGFGRPLFRCARFARARPVL